MSGASASRVAAGEASARRGIASAYFMPGSPRRNSLKVRIGNLINCNAQLKIGRHPFSSIHPPGRI
ncbi:hypothetical protein [Burkholderia oklahomensis]|uniref:hypothetical protein n=1 Tax=Burkholderia oklahomensis TaxID=342113 RepID=UPI001F2C3DD8|nr:hypothetical protein [Burkholderia oklahomensis]